MVSDPPLSPPRRRRFAALRRVAAVVLRPIIAILAVVYFVLDVLVLSLVRPIGGRLARLPFFLWLAQQVDRLGPYPTLALFLIPLVVLEPAKPVGLYLIGTKRVIAGTLVIVLAEVLKVFLLERLFHMSRPKLMAIPAFAWAYSLVMRWLAYLEALPPWRAVRQLAARMKELGRRIARAITEP